MSDWFDGQLADSIAALNAGVSVNAEDRPHGSGEIGVLKTSAVSGGQFLPDQNKTVVEHERRLVAEPVQGDSILVSRMNTPALVGESCYVREAHPSLFLPDRLWQLKPKDSTKISMRWMSFVLQSAAYRRHVEVHATGTSGSMKNLPKSKLLALPISYPGLTEQAQIAQILDTLDTAIFETESIIAKLKAVKQGLLHDLLTRGIDANGELRPPQAEAPHLYKESPLGWIPQEWGIDSIARACSDVVDCPHSTPHYQDQGVLVARTMHIKDGIFLDSLASRVSERQYRERIARLETQPGDLIFTREAPVGEAFVVPSGMRICLGQRVMLLRPRDGLLISEYLLAQVYSGAVKDRIATLTSGTTNPHLNVSDVKEFEIPLPPFVEQQGIADRLDELESRLQAEMREHQKLELLKSGLMDDLLTGRVRVTPLLEAAAP